MDIDDEDLPDINISQESSTTFEMPDASILATQRKLEEDQDIEIKKYQAEAADTQSCSEVSENEITNCMEALKVDSVQYNVSVTMPHENPGIDITGLHRTAVTSSNIIFISELLEWIENYTGAALGNLLHSYLQSLLNVLHKDQCSFTQEHVTCQMVVLCVMLLDIKCRKVVSTSLVSTSISILLNDIAENIRTENLLINMAEHLLSIFTHFHNRLYLVQCIQTTSIDPFTINTKKQTANRLALLISYGSLSDLVSYITLSIDIDNFNMIELKSLIHGGHKWKFLSPYEQFVSVMLVNKLFCFAKVREFDGCNIDLEAQKDILMFLNGIRCNENYSEADFLKVQVLISKTNLFWHDKRTKNNRNT